METTEKSTKMAVVKEFVYEFKANDRQPLELNSNSKIFLVINDHETPITIESLFIEKPALDEEDIEGYSILQLITGGTQLKIDENTTLKITFIEKISGRQFYISRIRRSMFYDDDIEISSEKRLKYIDLLLTTSMIPVEAQMASQAASQKEADAAAEAQAAELAKEKLKQEQLEAEQAEAQRKASIIGGEAWEGQREELLTRGLTEYIFDNYRMFYKDSEGDDAAEIGFFILSPGNYEFIELFEEEITDEKEEYSFEDHKEDEVRVVFDKVNKKIVVG